MSELDEVGDRLLVIYDGYCGLCNRSVRWSLLRDSSDRFRFVPSDSPKVTGLLARHGFSAAPAADGPGSIGPSSIPGSILVVRDAGQPTERVLARSDAILALLHELPSPWPAFAACFRWVPRPLRDLGYRLVARWRYRIWGRLDSCPIPTAAERSRFL